MRIKIDPRAMVLRWRRDDGGAMTRTLRRLMRVSAGAVLILAAGGVAAGPARADTDTDFANQLHGYGIYGQRDYNAWLAKIVCERTATGVDRSAFDSAKFLSRNLARDNTPQQTWLFLSAALSAYCPDQLPALAAAATPAL